MAFFCFSGYRWTYGDIKLWKYEAICMIRKCLCHCFEALNRIPLTCIVIFLQFICIDKTKNDVFNTAPSFMVGTVPYKTFILYCALHVNMICGQNSHSSTHHPRLPLMFTNYSHYYIWKIIFTTFQGRGLDMVILQGLRCSLHVIWTGDWTVIMVTIL